MQVYDSYSMPREPSLSCEILGFLLYLLLPASSTDIGLYCHPTRQVSRFPDSCGRLGYSVIQKHEPMLITVEVDLFVLTRFIERSRAPY